MWDLEPSLWKPINHSCNPNSWVTGLDLVARYDISPGEEITMDYATMYARDQCPKFDCQCNSKNCRKLSTGNEYLEDWFVQTYGTHVTPYVRFYQQNQRSQENGKDTKN